LRFLQGSQDCRRPFFRLGASDRAMDPFMAMMGRTVVYGILDEMKFIQLTMVLSMGFIIRH
jgi:hypothetical protein